jgi:hypothetical protein
MNRIAIAVVAALLAAPATAAPAAGSSSPVTGKILAPVTVEASLSEGSARVTVRFDRAATEVRVRVAGLDGLVVKGAATPVNAATFGKGEVATFDLAFTPGAGRSFLSIAVSGRFGGARRATAVSFPVGEKSAEQQKGIGTVIQGADGERVKVLSSGM